jgi:arylsulfatase
MNLKKTVATICAASAIVSVTPLQEAIANTLGQGGAKGPNFVNIVIDDMGFSDLGAFGGEINTPHLDELAGKGTILRNFYASPTSTPSRGMLFTGKDMHQVGTGNLVGWANSRPPQKGLSGYLGDLSEEALPFPELLQKNGYHTMMVGKWDLGSEAGRFPTDRGFDQSLVLVPGGDVHYITDDNGKIIRSRPPTQKCSDDTQKECTSYNENGEKFADFPKNAYATEFYTSEAIKMLEKWNQENVLSSNPEPFYLNVSHIAPHSPFQAPANIIEEYELIYTKGWDIIRKERFDRLKELGFVSPEAQLPPRPKEIQAWYELSQEQQQIEAKRMAVYAAMIHVMDQQVGKLIDHLKEIGQYNNTVFLVLSDNGGAFVPTGGPQRSRDYRNDTFSGDCRSGVFDENSEKVSKKCREDYGNMGNASSFINPNHGWGTVANTPFNRYKGDTFEGGVHTAAFVYYPKWPNH